MKTKPHVDILRESALHVKRRWRPMVGYALIMTALEVAVLAPLVSFVLARVVGRSGGGMVGNTDIVAWLLSPSGLVFALLAGSFMNLEFIFRAAGQYWIAESTDALMRTRGVVVQVLRRAPMLFHFSVVAFLLGVLLILPLAAGAGIIAVWFLSAHDINYYLATHPPEWYRALALAGTWGLIWGVATLLFVLRLAYALPAWLGGIRPIRRAFRSSWTRTREEWRALAVTLGWGIAIWLAAHFVLEGGLYLVMGWVVDRLGGTIQGLIIGISTYLVLAWILSTLISIAGLAWLVTVVARLFRGAPFVSDPTTESSQRALPALAWTHVLRPAVSVPALILLLGSSATFSWLSLRSRSELIRPVVIAHRAGATHAPENSLSALEIAIEQGADSAEIDVQRTRDGVVVVTHDADLMRAAGDPRVISRTRYEELADVDIGSTFGPEFAGEPLPTLAQYLAQAKDRMRLVIELKYYGGDPRLVPDVVKLVREAGMADQADLMSLDLAGVRQAQQEAPEMPAGYLATVTVGDLARLDVSFLAVSLGKATAPLLRAARGHGVPVYAWTVNDAEGILDLMDLGIDGIITDDSALAVRTIERALALSPAQRFVLSFRDLWDVLDETLAAIRDDIEKE